MILAAYLGSEMIFHTIAVIRNKRRFQVWLSENSMLVLLIAIWLSSQIFELNGMRAVDIVGDKPFEIGRTIADIPLVLKGMNHRYVFTIVILFAVGVTILLRSGDKEKRLTICRWGVASVLAFLYLILSCGKVGADYVRRPMCFMGFFSCARYLSF